MKETSAHRALQPPGWPVPKGYANGILVEAGSRMLFVAGQIAWTEEKQLVSDEMHEQFAQCLRNVVAVLHEAGGKPQHLIRLTMFVTDKNLYLAQTRLIGEHYRDLIGRHYPACTLVEVSGLLEPGALVEIEATAALPPED